MIPTSLALDTLTRQLERRFPGVWSGVEEVRRLQDQATRSAIAMTELVRETERLRLYNEVPVLDLVKYREDKGMVHHDGGDAA